MTWTGLGAGFPNQVAALEVFDDGSGPALHAGGAWSFSGSTIASGVARWDGTAWNPLGTGVSLAGPFGPSRFVWDLLTFDDGSGSSLYVAGRFDSAGSMPASNIARWDGNSWSPLGAGIGNPALAGQVSALATFDDGTGSALYAAGLFSTAGGVPASNIARWDGVAWSPLGAGLNGEVLALEVFDDGSGPKLWAGGIFSSAGGVPASNIAAWDGASWSTPPVGPGGFVGALEVFDDGTGPALYVGGRIFTIGFVLVRNLVRWDGLFWSSVGQGVGLPPGTNGFSTVRSFEVFDDGAGAALWVAGEFPQAGTIPAESVARWDGSWDVPSAGLGVPLQSTAHDMVGFDDGGGAALFVGGQIQTAGGLPVNHIARMMRIPPPLPPPPVPPTVPTLGMAQVSGPGGPVLVQNSLLDPGDEYFNLFSLSPCPGFPGSGPLLGLCATTPAAQSFLLSQLLSPLGTLPVHFMATSESMTFGPFALAGPITVDALALHLRAGLVVNASSVARLTIQ